MFWHDSKLPEEKPMWTTSTTEPKKPFGLDKVKVYATDDGSITVDFNGDYTLNIPAHLRHQFLDKIRSVVQAADVIDPMNDQLNTALTK